MKKKLYWIVSEKWSRFIDVPHTLEDIEMAADIFNETIQDPAEKLQSYLIQPDTDGRIYYHNPDGTRELIAVPLVEEEKS